MDPALAAFVRSLSNSANVPNMTQVEAHALARILNRTLNVCTSRHIQLANNAVITHILPYAHARAALLLYITALAKACKPRPANTIITHATTGTYELEGLQRTDDKYNVPSSAYKRLHALYLAHNLLFAVQNSTPTSLPPPYKSANMRDIEQDLLALINRLVILASCRGLATNDNVGSSIMKLLDYYLDQKGIEQDIVASLRGLAERCNEREWEQALDEVSALDDQKALDDQRAAAAASQWVLPKQHGAKDEPWYELPAANGLYMRRTRGYPLRAAAFPQGGYYINNGGQEASQELKKEVLALHQELVHAFEAPAGKEVQDIDPLGNVVHLDPARPTRNHWGFSLDGIKAVKELESSARRGAAGYAGVPRLRAEEDPFRDLGADVQRARSLAGGRGGRGGWRGGEGRGRGGFGAGFS